VLTANITRAAELMHWRPSNSQPDLLIRSAWEALTARATVNNSRNHGDPRR
jgi:hypothetical protein